MGRFLRHHQSIGKLSIVTLHAFLIAVRRPRLGLGSEEQQCLFFVSTSSSGPAPASRDAEAEESSAPTNCRVGALVTGRLVKPTLRSSVSNDLRAQGSEGESSKVLQPLVGQLGSLLAHKSLRHTGQSHFVLSARVDALFRHSFSQSREVLLLDLRASRRPTELHTDRSPSPRR